MQPSRLPEAAHGLAPAPGFRPLLSRSCGREGAGQRPWRCEGSLGATAIGTADAEEGLVRDSRRHAIEQCDRRRRCPLTVQERDKSSALPLDLCGNDVRRLDDDKRGTKLDDLNVVPAEHVVDRVADGQDESFDAHYARVCRQPRTASSAVGLNRCRSSRNFRLFERTRSKVHLDDPRSATDNPAGHGRAASPDKRALQGRRLGTWARLELG
jgi:hypothetical protein